MHPWIARNLIYHPALILRGEPTRRLQKEVRQLLGLDPEALRRWQAERLRSLLAFLEAHNPWYGRILKETGLRAGQVSGPEDLARLPLLTKDILRREGAALMSEGSWRLSPRKTSGSTGQPLRFAKDREATAWMDAAMNEVYGWHGLREGDRQARIWGMPLDTRGRLTVLLKDRLLNRRRLVSFGLTPESSGRFFRTLRRFRPAFLYGLVNTTVEFARLCREQGYDPAGLGLRAILTTGEILFPHQRTILAEAFGCPVVNEYGTTENGILAFECPEGGMHILETNVLMELVDDEGRPLPAGERGRVVVTELHSRALPFVRYLVGDLATRSTETCPCGRPLPLLREVAGRESDLILTPEGNRMGCGILAYAMPREVLRFRGCQREATSLEILLQPGKGFGPHLIPELEQRLRSSLGNGLSIRFQVVEEIPPDPSGKFRYFVSELPPAG